MFSPLDSYLLGYIDRYSVPYLKLLVKKKRPYFYYYNGGFFTAVSGKNSRYRFASITAV